MVESIVMTKSSFSATGMEVRNIGDPKILFPFIGVLQLFPILFLIRYINNLSVLPFLVLGSLIIFAFCLGYIVFVARVQGNKADTYDVSIDDQSYSAD
jgi:hypothetical protein